MAKARLLQTTTTKIDQRAAEYLKKQYARIVTPDPTGYYFAQILEFPGCVAEGKTPQEAYSRLEAAAEAWVASMLESGRPIPEPTYDKIRDYSGRIALRLPRSVHREAVRFAERDNTSLNQFLVSAVSAAVGAFNVYEQIARRVELRMQQHAAAYFAGLTMATEASGSIPRFNLATASTAETALLPVRKS